MGDADTDGIAWSLSTWEGARREQLRRWAELRLERIVRVLEEVRELAEWLHCGGTPAAEAGSRSDDWPDPGTTGRDSSPPRAVGRLPPSCHVPGEGVDFLTSRQFDRSLRARNKYG